MNDGVMVAYIPTNTSWCKQDLPHMTLVYAGVVGDHQPGDLNALAKDTITAARITGSFALPVTGVEVFGEGLEQVDVLTLDPSPSLLAARDVVAKWNASQYKDFAPHATIGPKGSASGNLPLVLYFDRILLAWGEQRLYFPLD